MWKTYLTLAIYLAPPAGTPPGRHFDAHFPKNFQRLAAVAETIRWARGVDQLLLGSPSFATIKRCVGRSVNQGG